jgi:hypothetical protein
MSFADPYLPAGVRQIDLDDADAAYDEDGLPIAPEDEDEEPLAPSEEAVVWEAFRQLMDNDLRCGRTYEQIKADVRCEREQMKQSA